MDKSEKKRLMQGYADRQKKEFENSLPMSRKLFGQLFDFLNEQSEANECAHNFNMTIEFLKKHECPIDSVLEWLMQNGAGCDCEVIFNVEEKFEGL